MSGRTLIAALALLAVLAAGPSCAAAAPLWRGANVKVSPQAPWGSDAAAASLRDLAAAGAQRALLVAFVWQATPTSETPVIGSGSEPERMRLALQQSRAAGLAPVLKVHLWIPGHWAGDAAPRDRAAWFAAYQRALLPLARVAESEHAAALVLATELRQLQDAPQWPALVAAVRAVYRGPLVYVADGLDHAETFAYWPLFDAVGTSLYPALPAEPRARVAAMDAAAARLQRLGARVQRPVWVAELGLRSAQGALAAPWESPEQRRAPVDLALQAQVLGQWRGTLQAHAIAGLAIWCWYTDPHAGGAHDSDFTLQGKPARQVLAH